MFKDFGDEDINEKTKSLNWNFEHSHSNEILKIIYQVKND